MDPNLDRSRQNFSDYQIGFQSVNTSVEIDATSDEMGIGGLKNGIQIDCEKKPSTRT